MEMSTDRRNIDAILCEPFANYNTAARYNFRVGKNNFIFRKRDIPYCVRNINVTYTVHL